MMRKASLRGIALGGAVFLTAMLSGACRSHKAVPPEETPVASSAVTNTQKPVEMTPSPIPSPSIAPPLPLTPDPHKGQERSRLTGQWMKKKEAKKRPYAVMLNNIREADPQSGTSQAVILYEALTEGGITRLMGIFESFDAGRIGSVRSARHYFVSVADEYDAILVHFGQTKYAKDKIAALGVDSLNGLDAIGGRAFYRDSSIRAPHNAFTGHDKILEGCKSKNYRTEYRKDFEHYRFWEEDTVIKGGKSAKKVTLSFSGYASPYFLYDRKEKCYKRYQFGGPHMDQAAKEQLAFKNLIIQRVKEWNIDKNGYQTMDIADSSGKGYYITDGKAWEITWQKNEATKKMHYYGGDGKQLVLNPGKTYIALFPDSRECVISDEK